MAVEPTHPLLRPKGHVADMAELEAIRDELVERLKLAREAAERRGERQHRARARLEEMVSDPAAHKWERLSKEDLGEPGCASVEVHPALGARRGVDELVASQGLVGVSVSQRKGSVAGSAGPGCRVGG